MSIELHIESRASLKPDPELDEIRVLFYHLYRDIPRNSNLNNSISGMIIVDPSSYYGKISAQSESIGSSELKPGNPLTLRDSFNSDDSSFISPTEKKPNHYGRLIDMLHINSKSRMLDRCGITNAWVEYVPDEDGLMNSLGLLMRR